MPEALLRILLRAARWLDRRGLRRFPPVRWLAAGGRAVIFRNSRRLPGRPVAVGIGGARLLVPHTAVASHVLAEFEPLTRAVLDDAAGPGAVVVDVGANVGFHALRLARRIGPQGRLFAVEPAEENLAYLRANLEAQRLSNVEILPLAASDARGTRDFYLQERGTHHGFFERPEGRGRRVTVEAAPLDELLAGPVDLVKIDTEGAELEVLRGMERLLAASPAVQVVVEWNLPLVLQAGRPYDELPAWLWSRGFAVTVLDDETGLRGEVEDVLSQLREGSFGKMRVLNLLARREAGDGR